MCGRRSSIVKRATLDNPVVRHGARLGPCREVVDNNPVHLCKAFAVGASPCVVVKHDGTSSDPSHDLVRPLKYRGEWVCLVSALSSLCRQGRVQMDVLTVGKYVPTVSRMWCLLFTRSGEWSRGGVNASAVGEADHRGASVAVPEVEAVLNHVALARLEIKAWCAVTSRATSELWW